MFQAKGLITPVLTALTEDEKFNPEAYSEFIDMLIKAGVHGIFPLGGLKKFLDKIADWRYTCKRKGK